MGCVTSWFTQEGLPFHLCYWVSMHGQSTKKQTYVHISYKVLENSMTNSDSVETCVLYILLFKIYLDTQHSYLKMNPESDRVCGKQVLCYNKGKF